MTSPTQTILDWIATKEELAKKATKGPWSSNPSVHGNQYRYVTIDDLENYTTLELEAQDSNFIADSRTTTPTALAIARIAVELIAEDAESEPFKLGYDGQNKYEDALRKITQLIQP